MRAVIYARYSSANQSEASIEDQVEVCRRMVEKHGWVVTEVYHDKSISGASTRRPAYQKMLQDAESGRFDVIVTEALDRLSRKLADVATMFDRITFLGLKIHTVATGEVSTMQIGMLGTMAQMYLSDLKEKTKRGQLGCVLDGRIPGGKAYGYDVVAPTIVGKTQQGGKRRINEQEAANVRRIFTDFATGASPRKIAKTLNEEGIPGPQGRDWRDTTIRGQLDRGTGLLNNATYVGRIEWNRVSYVKDPTTGKRQARINPKSDWEVVDVPELRIIDDDLWKKVKARQKAVRIEIGKDESGNALNRAHRRKFLLSGLMTCGVCGEAYTIIATDRYGCAAHKNKGTCANKATIRRIEIEGRVLTGLKDKLMAPDMVEEFTRTFHEELNKQTKKAAANQETDKKALKDTEKKLSGILSAIEQGAYSDALQKRLSELEVKKSELQLRLSDEAPAPVNLHSGTAEIYSTKVEHLTQSLNDPLIQTEANEVIRSLIDRIELTPHKDRLKAELYGDLAEILAFTNDQDNNTKRPSYESMGRKVSVVAGGRYQRCLHLDEVWL